MQIELTAVELVDLKVLRDRLDRERRESHIKATDRTMRTSDADRDYEAVARLVRRAEGGK